MADRKIFEEVTVDCNDCEAYWLNQCDGVSCDTERKCVSYIPTKRVDIPKKIHALENRIDNLNRWVIGLSIACILDLLVCMMIWR